MTHWSIIFLGIIIGMIIGKTIEGYKWRSVARGESGHFNKGRIYHVIEENDDDKWRMWVTIRRYLLEGK